MNIIFMGTPDFAVPSLKALIAADLKPVLCVSQPDRPQGRHRQCLPTPVKQVAQAAGIPVFQPTKVRDQAFLDTLAAYHPDIIVTAAYGRILTQAVLDLPTKGCLNVHGSLLPKYRGASPVQWAILNEDEETGVTLLEMTAELDAGRILRQAKMKLDRSYTADRLMKEIAELGAQILPETVKAWYHDEVELVAQDEDAVVTVGLLDRESGRLDWHWPAHRLDAWIRGMSPWPGAFTEWQGKRVKIYQAHPVAQAELALAPSALTASPSDLSEGQAAQPAQPGQRLQSPKGTLWLQTGEGILAIDEWQVEGAKRLTASACAHNLPSDLKWGEQQ